MESGLMISIPLARRTLRDYRLLAAGACLLLFTFVILFLFATDAIPLSESRQWLKLEWMRRLVNAMVGGEMADALTPTGVSSLVFTHPFTWVLVVAFVFAIATGVLSGEMDRGTIDLLATLPISRSRFYLSVSVVVYGLGIPIVLAAWIGVRVGSELTDIWQPDLMVKLAIVGANFYAVYFLIASLVLMLSAQFERRSVALTWSFLIVFYSFILNLLAAFWPAVKKIAFSGFLYYYAPLQVIVHDTVPYRDMAVLFSIGLACWVAGLLRFSRRDIHVT